MKATKKNKTLGTKEPKVSVVTDEDEAPEVEVVDDTPLVTSSGVPIVEDLDESLAQPSQVVSAAIQEAASLEIVFLEGLNDYPIIGHYNFQNVHGITSIRKHQKFVVPRDVALTLYDKGLVTIPSMV